MRAKEKSLRYNLALVTAVVFGLSMSAMVGVSSAGPGGLQPLNSVTVPLPPNLGDFVINNAAAIELGKALFWDMQAGSDGVQSCATCHFQAGSDVRERNTLNPGSNGIFNTANPGALLKPAFFPFTNNPLTGDSDDIGGAQGIKSSLFQSISGGAVDSCIPLNDPVFNVNGKTVRQVTGRKAPSAINAVFNFRSFWDGRANNSFNGVNPNGPDPQVTVLQVINGTPTPVAVDIPNASLASQATGPPLSPVEMSCGGRTFPDLGKKLLNLQPLAKQIVAADDSVLAAFSAFPSKGLTTTYSAMIQAAFDPKWWNSAVQVGGFSVMEQNFSLFWGLSIMLYESTLVSDDTPVDRFLAGNTAALNRRALAGMRVFVGKGRCNKCHSKGPLTEATVDNTGGNLTTGFLNTAVRPVAEDGGDILQPGVGAFKIPGVRNAELNAPYFHTGSMSTLRQVVDFYDRGGDFPSQFTDGDIRPLGLTEVEKRQLVAFMIALTDDRVRFERAPFDHPSLALPGAPDLPAVGAGGNAKPAKHFLGLSPFQP